MAAAHSPALRSMNGYSSTSRGRRFRGRLLARAQRSDQVRSRKQSREHPECVQPAVLGRVETVVSALGPELDLTADELNNQAELALTQQNLDRTDDSYLAVDGQPLTNFERLLSTQMAGRDHLIAAPKLIAIGDPSHRRTERYAHRTTSGTESARSSPARRLSGAGLTAAANGCKPHQRPLAIPTKHCDGGFRMKRDRHRSWAFSSDE